MDNQKTQPIPSSSSSEDKKYPFFFFSTVNRRVNPYDVKDQELWDCVNWWTEYRIGSKKVRPGYKLFMDRIDNNPVTGLFSMKYPNGNKRLFRASGKFLYAVDPVSGTTYGTPILSLASGNSFFRPDFTSLNGLTHMVSQISATESHYVEVADTAGVDSAVDTAYVSGGSDVVDPYLALTIVQYHRRIYVGSPFYSPNLYKSRLSWSTIDYVTAGTGGANTPWTNVPNDIITANYRNIDVDYKGAIIKLTSIKDQIQIYKEGGIYSYNENSVFDLFGLSPYQGSISTMEETKEDFFFTNEGFFKNDTQAVSPIGEGWYTIIKDILQNGIDPTKICSLAVNFLYFCFMGNITYDGNTITNAMFVYNAYFDEMYLWSMGHQMTSIGYYVDASGNKQVIFGDVNGFTYKLDYTANDDNGITIEAYFKTRYYFFDEPQKKNQISEMHGFAYPFGGEVEISCDPDFSGEYKYPLLALEGFFAKQRFDLSNVGAFQTLSFKAYWNGKGQRPEIYGLMPNIKQDSSRIVGRAKQ